MSRRKDPPVAQVKILIARSGNVCAYEGCSRELAQDADHAADPDKTLGKIAHICAESEHGPRFDPDMTPAQRGNASNLIYLCGDHHDIIDSHVNGHSAERIYEMKARHERRVARAVRSAMGGVTFMHLEAICNSLALMESPDAPMTMPIPVREKIAINGLSETTASRVRAGLARSESVENYIQFMSGQVDGYGHRLADWFRAQYFRARALEVDGDDLFDYVLQEAYNASGPVESNELKAAVVAIMSHLFEICEIFEHERATP